MEKRASAYFLALILVQTLHSIEEVWNNLWAVFAPARFISGLFTDHLALGFALANVVVVLFGFWCYAARVRPWHAGARIWITLWVVLELANGVVHPAMAVVRNGYFPGLATAPFLFLFAVLLLRESLLLNASDQE